MRLIAFSLAVLTLLAGMAVRASDTLAVIVPPGSRESMLSFSTLALIYEKKRVYWEDGSRIQPVNLPPASRERALLSQALYGRDVAALDDYWRERYFHGVRPPFVVASAEAMLRFIADTPTAIGYVDACITDPRVRVLGYLDARGQLLASRPVLDCDDTRR